MKSTSSLFILISLIILSFNTVQCDDEQSTSQLQCSSANYYLTEFKQILLSQNDGVINQVQGNTNLSQLSPCQTDADCPNTEICNINSQCVSFQQCSMLYTSCSDHYDNDESCTYLRKNCKRTHFQFCKKDFECQNFSFCYYQNEIDQGMCIPIMGDNTESRVIYQQDLELNIKCKSLFLDQRSNQCAMIQSWSIFSSKKIQTLIENFQNYILEIQTFCEFENQTCFEIKEQLSFLYRFIKIYLKLNQLNEIGQCQNDLQEFHQLIQYQLMQSNENIGFRRLEQLKDQQTDSQNETLEAQLPISSADKIDYQKFLLIVVGIIMVGSIIILMVKKFSQKPQSKDSNKPAEQQIENSILIGQNVSLQKNPSTKLSQIPQSFLESLQQNQEEKKEDSSLKNISKSSKEELETSVDQNFFSIDDDQQADKGMESFDSQGSDSADTSGYSNVFNIQGENNGRMSSSRRRRTRPKKNIKTSIDNNNYLEVIS